jgi:aerobic-type carbon monoxide dehydrogenase small subunit (CoxS/CutS family)
LIKNKEGKHLTSQILYVNGRRYTMTIPLTYTTLIEFLRRELQIKSVRRGCDFGGCGACTVLVQEKTVYSCMYPLNRAVEKEIITLEGITDTRIGKELVELFAKNHAYQCGYCTPGIILSAYSLLSRSKDISEGIIREWLSGNICRCTGYSVIVDTILEVFSKICR